MQCDYFDAGVCSSCNQMGVPYATQLLAKENAACELFSHCEGLVWLPSAVSDESAFRNKAKIVVAGTVTDPTLGIVDARTGCGTDLSGCGLYTFEITRIMPVLRELIIRAGLTPYDIPGRKGELKNILVTASASGEVMLRFVLRSKKLLVPIRRELARLHEEIPSLAVVSINLLREHVALVEGDEEIVLTQRTTLPMQVNEMTLHLRPQSFFQTNTGIAEAMYHQGRAWVADVQPKSVWDLYCGVGGFALHAAAAAPSAQVEGIEISEEAILSAQRTVAEQNLKNLHFVAGDATAFAVESERTPELLIMNPPRRGVGQELSHWVEESGIDTVIYSSCNAKSLAKDLTFMPSYQPVEAKVLDMFPQTSHYEMMMLLKRRR
ncbi:23S rRNA (uracil(747)-C(5))-methyltransferase RlmC [Rothia sp. ZJ1223]|uniref:23S rRNA (uracil(747)-C(5))-methyltransferase RlmC n=1 Tax=Rothia sp. ZJ1223 TaxID=2811098 RepID=UPI00195BF370|nr:23S rRNA (uracil(747)-C(5))-methyltransferase RlmC [Rothia sp. ZJ1223]MBM7052039.1 23S rRNA (uracil(747)-C(5))-methyltransferase RlmC [Rothia sp. ZJ1223]